MPCRAGNGREKKKGGSLWLYREGRESGRERGELVLLQWGDYSKSNCLLL